VLLLLASCGPGAAARLYKTGEEEWQAGRYEQAVEAFARVTEAHPKDERADDALLALGDIHYLFLNRYEDALVFYLDLIDRYPSSPLRSEARMKMASIYRGKKEDRERAILEYQKVLNEKAPPETAAEAQFAIAECFAQAGNFSQAATEYEIFLSGFPDSDLADKARLGLAHCEYAQGQCQKAIEQYRKIEKGRAPDEVANEARFGIASCYEESGLLAEAREEFTALLDVYPSRPLIEEHLRRIAELEKRLRPPAPKAAAPPRPPAATPAPVPVAPKTANPPPPAKP
jgi:TolA-binding protein